MKFTKLLFISFMFAFIFAIANMQSEKTVIKDVTKIDHVKGVQIAAYAVNDFVPVLSHSHSFSNCSCANFVIGSDSPSPFFKFGIEIEEITNIIKKYESRPIDMITNPKDRYFILLC